MSPEILKIGLLFGEDVNATTMDLPAVLTFQHKLIQEYLAAVYIAEKIKLSASTIFLTEAFPTKEKMVLHKEVLQFACGILGETDNASPLVNHIGSLLAQDVYQQLNLGIILDLSGIDIILKPCEKESGITRPNPYLCEYPSCEHPLAEVLSASKLVYINGVSRTDTLHLIPCSADILLYPPIDIAIRDKLLQALEGKEASVISLRLSGNVTKLSRFSKLKQLHNSISLPSGEAEAMEDLAESIKSWGTEPPLTHWKLVGNLSESVMSSLCLCTQLLYLDLNQSNLRDKLCLLMASPPPALKELRIHQCSLGPSDVDSISQAVKCFKLSQLEKLDISDNRVGEPAVNSLLEAFTSTRPNRQMTIKLVSTALVFFPRPSLSDKFVAEWKTKLKDSEITAIFSLKHLTKRVPTLQSYTLKQTENWYPQNKHT